MIIMSMTLKAFPMALLPLAPEIFVASMLGLLVLISAFSRQSDHPLVYHLTQVTLLLAAWLTYRIDNPSLYNVTIFSMDDSFVFDQLAFILKEFVYLTAFVSFIYAKNYNALRKIPNNEFYVLGLLSVLGMMVLISAHSLLTLYLGVELMSLPIYAMVALHRKESRCVEASMKYFVMGALASGLLLYGMSMIFGATQNLDLAQIASRIFMHGVQNPMMLTLGLVFMLAGILFKLGVAPFHAWVPDVYEGAPTSTTVFLSAAPKIAAFALLIRLLVNTLPTLALQWQWILITAALLSLGIGNLTAIMQTNVKRMLAYSSIAHMGYALLGVACANSRGEVAALFYLLSYTIMSLGAFGVVLLLSHAGFEAETLQDFAGLNTRHPGLAFIMLLIMFSMAGVPPIVGFIAKVGILEALIQAHFVALAVVALLFAIVGAYYYLRLVKVMYFDEPLVKERLIFSREMQIVLSLNGIAVLLLGVFPGILLTLCHSAL